MPTAMILMLGNACYDFKDVGQNNVDVIGKLGLALSLSQCVLSQNVYGHLIGPAQHQPKIDNIDIPWWHGITSCQSIFGGAVKLTPGNYTQYSYIMLNMFLTLRIIKIT